MNRIATAELFAIALHDHHRLADERHSAMVDAATPQEEAGVVADALHAIERLERSGAMCDTPEEREAFYRRYRLD